MKLAILSVCLLCNVTLFAQFNYEASDSLQNLHHEQEAYDLAIPFVEEARTNAAKDFGIEDSIYVFYTNKLAVFYEETGVYDQAETLYLEAKVLIEKIFPPNHSYRADNLFYLAGLYKNLGRYEEAEPFYLAAIEIDKLTIGTEHLYYSYSLANLALLYADMDNFEAAEPLYSEAGEILKKELGEEHPTYGTMLNNVGLMYSGQNNYVAANRYYLQAHAIYQNALGGDHPVLVNTLNNIAGVFHATDEDQKAETYYLEAVTMAKKVLGETDLTYALTLTNLATLYTSMERYAEAKALYQKTSQVYKEKLGDQHPQYATVLGTFSICLTKMKDFDEAETALLTALKIYEQTYGKTHSDYLKALNHLASFYNETNQKELSLRYCYQSLSNNCIDVDSVEEADFGKLVDYKFYHKEQLSGILSMMTGIYQSEYDSTQQIAFLKKEYSWLKAAMQMNEQERNSFKEEKDKLKILKEMGSLAKRSIKTAYKLSENGKNKKLILEAFSYAEQNKSILLADALKGQRARTMGDLPDSLALREIELQKEKSALEKEELVAKTKEAKNATTKAQNELQTKIIAFDKVLKDKYPKYHAYKYEKITAKAADIQSLLTPQTAFLEYFVAENQIYLFVLTPEKVELLPIEITKEALSKDIKKLRKSLVDYQFIVRNEKAAYELYTRKAHDFYNLLLKDALKDQDFKNLIIVADGELGHLPFEAFLTKSAEQGHSDYRNMAYLVNDYNISYNYSATLFKENHLGYPVSPNGKFLACGASYPEEQDSNLTCVRPAHLCKLRSTLSALPNIEHEIKNLSTIFEGDFLMGKESNEAFFKEKVSEYGIIHLAMHGLLHPRIPILSSLVFTEDLDSLEDNFLQAHEISKLRLNAELVVLSACETGFGQFEQGEGIISLARSFMYAGVPSLVVSLWQVNDASTAMIMEQFYRNIKDGMTKDAALRQAKLDYISTVTGLAAHPAFWSPFIQLGDRRAMMMSAKWGGTLFLFIGIGCFLLLGFIFKRKRANS